MVYILRMMDDTDRTILTILQRDGRIANAEIARQIGMAPSAILERVRKLEERGVIRDYTARVDPAALGHGLLAFVLVRTADTCRQDRTGPALAELPEVQEVHHIAGDDCFLIKVRARDTEDLGRLLRERLGALDSVKNTRTTVVLETLKESTLIPVLNPEVSRGA